VKTVGLFNEDSRIYFIDDNYIIMDNPYDGGTVLCKRLPGEPAGEDWKAMAKALLTANMRAKGNAYIREDGLWCCLVEERR